jgi:hypothetical protein
MSGCPVLKLLYSICFNNVELNFLESWNFSKKNHYFCLLDFKIIFRDNKQCKTRGFA